MNVLGLEYKKVADYLYAPVNEPLIISQGDWWDNLVPNRWGFATLLSDSEFWRERVYRIDWIVEGYGSLEIATQFFDWKNYCKLIGMADRFAED